MVPSDGATSFLFVCLLGFRARRLLGSLCAHNVRYARKLGSKINVRDSQFGGHNQESKQLGFGFRG